MMQSKNKNMRLEIKLPDEVETSPDLRSSSCVSNMHLNQEGLTTPPCHYEMSHLATKQTPKDVQQPVARKQTAGLNSLEYEENLQNQVTPRVGAGHVKLSAFQNAFSNLD